LNPIRSFEAAARHGSFSRAAEELHVTPVAISRQVAVLEGYFGVTLFDRLHHSLQLTPAGRDLLPCASAAFDLLDEGSRKLRAPEANPIVICTYPSVAVHWLIPRLSRFRKAHPGVEIRLTTAVDENEFDYDKIDVGLHYMRSAHSGLVTRLVLPDIIQPACSPKLLEGSYPLPPVMNLSHHTFLHSQHRQGDWEGWLYAAGLEQITPADEVTFKGSGLAYQAAAEGMGVSIVQRLLVEEEISSGRLITPFKLLARRSRGICMSSRKERLEDQRVKAFCHWLDEEASTAVQELEYKMERESCEIHNTIELF